ncbi:hypothetical protein AGMMS50284_6300 [Clostridia bacterium]|nr:hypothetical protein AGMMS50284_6300 [Clostridia bacterium]
MKIAAASTDGINVDEHFGRAEFFTVVDVDEDGKILNSEIREGLKACGGHTEEGLSQVLQTFSDCSYILANKIGMHMVRAFAKQNIASFEVAGSLQKATEKIAAYEKKTKLRKVKS